MPSSSGTTTSPIHLIHGPLRFGSAKKKKKKNTKRLQRYKENELEPDGNFSQDSPA